MMLWMHSGFGKFNFESVSYSLHRVRHIAGPPLNKFETISDYVANIGLSLCLMGTFPNYFSSFNLTREGVGILATDLGKRGSHELDERD